MATKHRKFLIYGLILVPVLIIPSAYAQSLLDRYSSDRTVPLSQLIDVSTSLAQSSPTLEAADRSFQDGVAALQAGENQWEAAVQLLEQAASLYEQLNLPVQQAGSLGNLGVAYRIREDYTTSLMYLQQAYTLMKEAKNLGGEWTAVS